MLSPRISRMICLEFKNIVVLLIFLLPILLCAGENKIGHGTVPCLSKQDVKPPLVSYFPENNRSHQFRAFVFCRFVSSGL